MPERAEFPFRDAGICQVLPGGVQPIRASVSISVERGTPKLRHIAALLAPPSRATVIAATFSASIAGGLPPRRPRRLAADTYLLPEATFAAMRA
ncbi:hypothetical protein, partial [Komagataeibacter europaeus]